MNFIKSVQSGLSKIPPFKKVVVGVSGGADSVVLAHVLKGLGYEIVIAHLNHQLRDSASDEDERFVKNLAKDWGVLYSIKKCFIPKEGNLENNARKIRYAFLEDIREKYGADFIAVAHHFDDQTETILMHMERGCGLRGKMGMKHINGKVIRPLLDVDREGIVDYAVKNSLEFQTDESNYDMNFNRNLWRHFIIPNLKKKIPDLDQSVMTISEDASNKFKDVFTKARRWISVNFLNKTFDRNLFDKLSHDIKSEILIQILGANDLYGKNLNQLINFIQSGQSGKEMKVKDINFYIEHDHIRLSNEEINKIDLPKTKLTIKGIKWGKWVIKAKSEKNLFVRQYKTGDKFQPSGMTGHKKLQNFFVDNKIPKSERNNIPIIVNESDEILSVGNFRKADGVDNKIVDIHFT